MKSLTLLITIFMLSILQINAQEGWGEVQKLTAANRFAGQHLGNDIDIDGDYAVVGGSSQPFNSYNEAYVFKKDNGGDWVELPILESPDYAPNDFFGNAVAISGNTILVGARANDTDEDENNTLSAAGAVYVYVRDAIGNWNFQQKLVASDRQELDQFGFVIDIDGDRAIIGLGQQSYDENGENYIINAGAAYVFERNGDGIWNEVQKIVASDRSDSDYFARNSVAIDNDYVVVGTRYEDHDQNGAEFMSSAGSAYIFKRDATGVWNEVQKVVASDRQQGDWFGFAVAMDGETFVVSANYEGIPGADATRAFGAAYIFELGENNTWVETQKIVASDRIRDDEFGTSIAIDENRIISGTIGKSYDPDGTYEPSRGVAYVFEKNALGTWNQVQKFFALDGNMGDELGYAVAVSGDIAMVSALLQDYDSLGTNYLPSTGAVYVLDANAEPLVSAFQCPYPQADYGSSCDDGNDLTENDVLNEECVCLGTPIPDCPDLSANIGDACNDGNTNTLGDIVTDDCICMGQVPDVGTVCEASIEVTSLPYLTTDNTENYGDDYSSSNFPPLAPGALGNPTSSYLNGDDVVYSYTPTANGLISITVSDRGDWVGFFVFTGCPFASTLGGRAEQNAETVMTIEQLPVISGLTYYIVISTWANPQTTPYTLSISEFEFDCPELSANIGDSCDDNDNTTFNDNVSETCECVGTPYDCPALTANIGDACDDGNANSTQDVITENCECLGVIVYDCPDLSANIGDSCDDGNSNTENDIVTASCFCTGTFVFDCPDLSANIGDSCDDNNPNTVGDVITENCVCEGSLTYDCEDLQSNIGDSCDDNNSSTENDVVTSDCECVGTLIYDCPALSANIGDSCDDNNPNTVGDVITENCVCEGSLTYDCEDLQSNIGDSCDDNNSSTENDVVTSDCECVGTVVYDCPALSANIGDSCDDGNENTVDDAITETCECEGSLTYDCEDLQANIGDSCDDNNSSTENDVVTSDCECVGTVVFDCPALSANIGDSCDDNDPNTVNDAISETCECLGKDINPTDCQEVVYYLSDYSSISGTDVYKVSLSQGIATLDYLANHPDEVHLAYSNAQNMLYAVSKSLNQYSTINPHAAILAFSAPYSLNGTYGEISGAAFAPNGDLYFCSQSTNMIYSLNVATGVAQIADNFSPISGGDIAFGNDGTPYLVTNAYGGGLYETHPSSQMEDSFLAPLEGISTGMALSATDQLLVSTRNSSILTILNTDGTMVDENYELILNGEQFILNYGDMASGCDTYDPITLETCMEHNTFYAEKNGNQTDIYAVNFDGTDANLSLLTTVDFEAAIAYRAINDALYMVSKTGSYIRTFHPATDTFSPDIYLSIQLNSITAAESERFATGLYIGDANTNGVYYVNPSRGETEFIISAEVFGGDLAISYFDSLYLASQSGNGLYQVGSETVNQVGSIPQGVTGAARTKFTSTILFSNYLATTFSEININDGALISTYNVKLNGQPFTLGYGDLAADCGVYFNRPGSNDQFAGLLEYKSVLTSRPNPTSGASQVGFTTVETGRALLEVYDMNSRKVATLFNQEAQEGREYRIDFNGSNLPNGIYVYRLTTQNETVIEKFMIAK